MTKDELLNWLKKYEGFSAKPYKCAAGRLTIGYGRNIEDVGISALEAEFLLKNDIERVEKELRPYPWFSMQPECVKCALINMGFMGTNKLLKFVKMIKALLDQDYTVAAYEAINSKWAKDVGKNRATDVALAIRKGSKK